MLGLSQKEIAERFGVKQQTWANYERGERNPSLELLAQIGVGEGVDLHWLLTGEGEMRRSVALAPTGAGKIEAALRTATALHDAGKAHPAFYAQPVGFVTEGDATVRIPIYDGLSAGLDGGLEALGHILGFGDFFLDWIKFEARIDPKRAFVAPVRGDSMMKLLYDGDLVLGELQDYLDREGVFAASLNGHLVVKHAAPGPKRGEITLSSENPRYTPRVVSEANGDELRLIGRIARRLTGLTSTPL